MTNFFRTTSVFFKNPFINPYKASLRHSAWAFRKIFNLFPCTIPLGNKELWIPNRSIANGSAALVNAMGYYDPNNMLLLENVIINRIYESFLDVGSNIGIYSLLAAGLADRMKIFAFEPHPYTFFLLNENIRINHLEDKIISCQLALAEINGEVLFQNRGGHPENQVLDTPMPGENTLMVTAGRGDDFCRKLGLRPEVIKIDVEGYENHVIKGFDSIIDSIQLMFVECRNIETTMELLCEKSGFLGPFKVDYKRRRFTYENCNYEDWVFVNPRSKETLSKIMSFN